MVVQNLSDLDWSVRLVLSSDKLSNLRQGVLLLRLTSVDDGGIKKETLLEFDASEIEIFLGHLRDAKQVRLPDSEVT